MANINFSTANQTFRQLFGNGLTYQVPRFQRDYSWTEDQWEDLWEDIQQTLPDDGEPAHYMGYLVLQTHDQKIFDVIDGQQRLTTINLLILAILKALQDLIQANVDPERNQLRATQLRNSYIGYLDPVTLIPRNKLTLNRNNDAYYKDYLVPLQKLPIRNRRASEHLLRKAFEWFYKKVRETYGKEQSGESLARFIDGLADKLFFTVIVVTDELNAFKVFETLNARGVRLSPTDLLKNYLFSVVDREKKDSRALEELERRWDKIVEKLGNDNFTNFLRVHWNSRNKFVRQADLFKTIRLNTPDSAQVFELIRQLDHDVDVYNGFTRPDDELWTREQGRYIKELRLYNVRQPWPILLAAYRAYDEQGFTAVLRACSIVTFRYNIIGERATNEQERVYNSIAQQIGTGALRQSREAIRLLKPLYLNDDDFQSAFVSKTLKTTSSRNTQIAKHILFAIESALTNETYDVESSKYSLEHILPENPGENWEGFSDDEYGEAVYKLGNFTLLHRNRNSQLGNKSFAEKRDIYAESSFEQTRRVAEENDVWHMGRIRVRQQWMAKQAKSIWRITQLS